MKKAIGGYFELQLPGGEATDPVPGALAFQSARAAFLSLLRAGKPRRVWLPRYCCGALALSVERAGVPAVFYRIDEGLEVSGEVVLQEGDWLLYVDYFGICARQVERLLERFDPRQIVVDRAQALFSPRADCLATLYSPRKFFGLPDGGLLCSGLEVSPPAREDEGSFKRMTHLLKRLCHGAEAGYEDYRKAEKSLEDPEPLAMSCLTRLLLRGQDFASAAAARRENFLLLHRHLVARNPLPIDPRTLRGPLCYPLLVEEPGARERLIAEGIFVPSYWPEATDRAGEGSFEARLVRCCLHLPVDQRYHSADMRRILNVLQRINR